MAILAPIVHRSLMRQYVAELSLEFVVALLKDMDTRVQIELLLKTRYPVFPMKMHVPQPERFHQEVTLELHYRVFDRVLLQPVRAVKSLQAPEHTCHGWL